MTSPQARILIVEDDEGVRRSLGLALGDEGYEVVLTENASQALAAFEAEAPDLMLIDVMLPGQNGLDLCRTIRQTSMVPVIMVTVTNNNGIIIFT